MSDLSQHPELQPCPAGAARPEREAYPMKGRELNPGLMVARALPQRQRRLIGAWCFLDRMGPLDVTEDHRLNVAPHPHIGLQTVTWLISGAIHHRDTLGINQVIEPGQLNLMTAGNGIAHSEEGLTPIGQQLFGVQFWVALPKEQANCAPAFEHFTDLPRYTEGKVTLTLFAGDYASQSAPAKYFTPLFGAELKGSGEFEQVLEPGFEYGFLLVKGEARLDGQAMSTDQLYYLGTGHHQTRLELTDAVIICLGGKPFGEDIVMWWNFVGRSTQEIADARARWQAGGFGDIPQYPGSPTPAPELQGNLKAGH
ncbi:MAG: pirin family protein [Pseudomonadota bacterium]|uniref:pirin family protein n=1 Tax=Gallaecimonas pentaromativorans TaxID=584787 RepID=UPI00067E7969|nr:pirin family protein [Gallaecimonas pentaromativorans]MED5526954.1 pirin family protein [Pseudomonadota bacterium]